MISFLHSLPPWMLLGSGVFFGYAKTIWDPVHAWIDRKLWISVEAVEPEKAYYELDAWIESCPRAHKVRNFYLKVSDSAKSPRLLVPGFGANFFMFEGSLVTIIRYKSDSPGAGEKQVQTLKLRFLLRNKQFLDRVIEKAHFTLEQQLGNNRARVYVWGVEYFNQWSKTNHVTRSINTVSLPYNRKEAVVQDLHNFLNSEQKYKDLGIPYGRGLLLHGPPGTGKTSLLSALASHFNLPLYNLNLGAMADIGFQQAISKISDRGFVVLEDIDAVVPNRAGPPGNSVSLPTLLNVMDGFLRPHGCIFCLTTNHPEKLDPALLRPGRVDLNLSFHYADEQQIRELFLRFHPNATRGQQDIFVNSYEGRYVTAGTVQGDILANQTKEKELVLEGAR